MYTPVAPKWGGNPYSHPVILEDHKLETGVLDEAGKAHEKQENDSKILNVVFFTLLTTYKLFYLILVTTNHTNGGLWGRTPHLKKKARGAQPPARK